MLSGATAEGTPRVPVVGVVTGMGVSVGGGGIGVYVGVGDRPDQ